MKENWTVEPELSCAPIKYGSLATDLQVELRGQVWATDPHVGVTSIKTEFKAMGVGEITWGKSANKEKQGPKLSSEASQHLEVRQSKGRQ